jgi:hypothetical protein
MTEVLESEKWRCELTMGKFLAIHPMPAPITFDEGAPIAKAVKANSTLDAYWISSWGQLNEQGKITKLFCEWDAKDVESINKIVSKIPGLRTEGVYPMAKVDAEAYR